MELIMKRIVMARITITADGKRRIETCAKKNLCLCCLQPIEASEKVVRGVHFRCYKRLNARMNKGAVKESDLIRNGEIGESLPPGRKPIEPAKIGDIQ